MLCKTCKQEMPDSSAFCPWCGKKQTTAPRKALKRPNGAGSVYKLSGRRKRPWAASKNRVIIRYNMTFKEVFEEWKAEHYREIGEKGVESYDRAYDVFEPLHDRKFRDLRTADFQAILDKYMDVASRRKFGKASG